MFRDFFEQFFFPLVVFLAVSFTAILFVAALARVVMQSGDDDTTYAVTLPSGETLHGLQLKYDSLESERTRFKTPDGKVLVVKGPHVIVEETKAEREGK